MPGGSDGFACPAPDAHGSWLRCSIRHATDMIPGRRPTRPALWTAHRHHPNAVGCVALHAGPLPSSWGALSKLRVVKLHMNRLSGPLPSNWSGLAGLEELVLGVNALTGGGRGEGVL